jgi:hypothetical protein
MGTLGCASKGREREVVRAQPDRADLRLMRRRGNRLVDRAPPAGPVCGPDPFLRFPFFRGCLDSGFVRSTETGFDDLERGVFRGKTVSGKLLALMAPIRSNAGSAFQETNASVELGAPNVPLANPSL